MSVTQYSLFNDHLKTVLGLVRPNIEMFSLTLYYLYQERLLLKMRRKRHSFKQFIDCTFKVSMIILMHGSLVPRWKRTPGKFKVQSSKKMRVDIRLEKASMVAEVSRRIS